MRDNDQKLIFEAYQQLNEIGGGGFNPGAPGGWHPQDPSTPDDPDPESLYDDVQEVIDAAVEENGYPRAADDEGWDELFNAVWAEPGIEEHHGDILKELLDGKRKEIETVVRQAEVQSAQAGMDMDAAGNMWNPYS